MYAESPAGPREGRQLAVVRPPIRSRRVNPSPAIQEAPLGARNPGWGQGGTGLGGLGEATSFTNRRWYRAGTCAAPNPTKFFARSAGRGSLPHYPPPPWLVGGWTPC